ncbi:hypothetical protein EZV62_028050 [Acer yangbiense]|uniref:Neprosin PEP catalytic domain-containing protein n=1 Tax=Acer yangbiense TaxID=1000413 RepID=A0A5C7GQ54_9ROSI|nr:hypothetical protein EZV62_028050 [Acer yangbiense]
MEKRVSMVLFLLLLAVSVLSDVADGKAKDRATLSGLDRKLKLLNKPAVKSIKSEDGDIIDCVDINKQPAFDHPALRNHKIQMRPSFDLPTEKPDTRNESSQPVIQQTWPKSGSCPEGTVPIRRIRKQDLLRAASLEQFGTKPPNVPYASSKTDIKNIISPPSINNTKFQVLSTINRSCAVLVTEGHYYTGAQGDINLWNPTVDLPDDYTTAQIWLKAGYGEIYESIEGMDGWYIPSYMVIVHRDFLHIGLASFVEWGGEVYSPNIVRDRSHTKTQMGSGSIAQTLEGSAATIRVVRIMDTTRKLKYPEWVGTWSDEQYCYSALNHVPGNNVEPVFYFGGPGQGPQCK